MLEKIHRAASRAALLLPFAILVAIGALFALAASLQAGTMGQGFIPSLLVFCWSLLLYSVISVFRHPPADPEPGARFLVRLASRLRRAARWAATLLFLTLTIALVVISYKLLAMDPG